MRLRFDHDGPEGEEFEVPDRRLLGVFHPRDAQARGSRELFESAFAEPVGSPPLAELARGARRVLVLVDDGTRHTRAHEILPLVAAAFAEAGLRDGAVTVVAAQGSHRPMSPEEWERKIGAEFVRRWRCEAHDWADPGRLVDLGATRDGMPIVVNARVPESDLVLGVGGVGVHGLKGFSGGAKIVFPGVGGKAQLSWTHWNATKHRPEALLGAVENPLRRNIEEAARAVGLDVVVNVVMDGHHQLEFAAMGDFVQAQRACARRSFDLVRSEVPRRAAVVVVDPWPAERDYWQTVKGLYAASLVVEEGGVTVLVAPNPEGVAKNHPNVLGLAALPYGEIAARVEAGRVDDVLGAAVAGLTAQYRERSAVFLVSRGVSKGEAEALGFEKFGTPRAAVEEALRRVEGEVAVLRHAGNLLPLVPGNPVPHFPAELQSSRNSG